MVAGVPAASFMLRFQPSARRKGKRKSVPWGCYLSERLKKEVFIADKASMHCTKLGLLIEEEWILGDSRGPCLSHSRY